MAKDPGSSPSFSNTILTLTVEAIEDNATRAHFSDGGAVGGPGPGPDVREAAVRPRSGGTKVDRVELEFQVAVVPVLKTVVRNLYFSNNSRSLGPE